MAGQMGLKRVITIKKRQNAAIEQAPTPSQNRQTGRK
jgi:hypothetical protein